MTTDVTVSRNDLYNWVNTASVPVYSDDVYRLKITGLLDTDCTETGLLHQCITEIASYRGLRIDLGGTELPVMTQSAGFKNLFKNATCLYSPPYDISENVDSDTCFDSMFEGCINMKNMARFSVRHKNNFYRTFAGCTSLRATNVAISKASDETVDIKLDSTFYGCTSLYGGEGSQRYFYVFSRPRIKSFNQTFYGCTGIKKVCLFASFSETPWEIELDQTFVNCTSLIEVVSGQSHHDFDTATGYVLTGTFKGCISLVTAPYFAKLSTTIDMYNVFRGCSSLTTVTLPTNVISLTNTFYGCSSLRTVTIPSTVENMIWTFKGCTSMTSMPSIPSRVTQLYQTFENCTSLTSANIPTTVKKLIGTFRGCTSLATASNLHNTITELTSAFYGCSALTTINNFKVPKTVLTQNAENCFYGCTNLSSIKVPNSTQIVPQEATDWHVFRLKFGASTVEGKVYDKTGNATNIAQTSITKSTLKLPIKTDELWFPSGYTDAQIDEIIDKMIQYKYTVFNKEVIPPDEKSFVMYADDPSKVISNIPALNLVDEVTSGNMQSVTSNAVAVALGNQEIVYQTNGLTIIGIKCQNGTYLNFHFSGFMSNTNIDYPNTILATLPQNYRPLDIVRIIVHMAISGDRIALGVDIDINGELTCYPLSKDTMAGSVTCNGIYGDVFCRIL